MPWYHLCSRLPYERRLYKPRETACSSDRYNGRNPIPPTAIFSGLLAGCIRPKPSTFSQQPKALCRILIGVLFPVQTHLTGVCIYSNRWCNNTTLQKPCQQEFRILRNFFHQNFRKNRILTNTCAQNYLLRGPPSPQRRKTAPSCEKAVSTTPCRQNRPSN